jgi:cell division protein FtsW
MALFATAGFLAVRFIGHAAQRVAIWQNPWIDPQGASYQVVQGLVAVASGGLFGSGLGLGRPDLIPAAQTDFPFSVLAEETGMLGALAVLAVFLALTFRGFHIAMQTRDGFRKLLAMGLTTVIALQTLIIIAGNLRAIPLTGITLPFISYGGSSLLSNFIIVGLLLRISHENRTGVSA